MESRFAKLVARSSTLSRFGFIKRKSRLVNGALAQNVCILGSFGQLEKRGLFRLGDCLLNRKLRERTESANTPSTALLKVKAIG